MPKQPKVSLSSSDLPEGVTVIRRRETLRTKDGEKTVKEEVTVRQSVPEQLEIFPEALEPYK